MVGFMISLVLVNHSHDFKLGKLGFICMYFTINQRPNGVLIIPLKPCLLSLTLTFANLISLFLDMYSIQQVHGVAIVEVRTIISKKRFYLTKFKDLHHCCTIQ